MMPPKYRQSWTAAKMVCAAKPSARLKEVDDGWVIMDRGAQIGAGKSVRSAWNDALSALPRLD